MKYLSVAVILVAFTICVSFPITNECIDYLLAPPGTEGHEYEPDVDGYVDCVFDIPGIIEDDGSINWDQFENEFADDLIEIHKNIPNMDPEIFREAAKQVVDQCKDNSESNSDSSEEHKKGKKCLKKAILDLFHSTGPKQINIEKLYNIQQLLKFKEELSVSQQIVI